MSPLKSDSASPGFVLVANPDPVHVGGHIRAGAAEDKIECELHDLSTAYSGHPIIRKLNWWFRGHLPSRLRWFSDQVVGACQLRRPACVLGTGIVPLDEQALRRLGDLGIPRLNFLTDDPFNPTLRAEWFLRGLSAYDAVFTPRLANRDELVAHGCRNVFYLPFGYAPAIHYTEASPQPSSESAFLNDVSFIGAADKDRIPYISALLSNRFRVSLYGGFWNRYTSTRRHARGIATPAMMRKIAGESSVSLCLVRRANRDGHCMRTFELAAMGACILAENTEDHQRIFGAEGESVLYFAGVDEMVEKVKWLVAHPSESVRLRRASHRLITSNPHTYRDRLRAMFRLASIPCTP